MWKRLAVALCVLSVGVLSLARGQESDRALEKDVSSLLEGLKSRDAGEREAAVREFMALREAVSDELQSIVTDRDNGQGTDAGKDLALSLMGIWRLAQCEGAIRAQMDRHWVKRPHSAISSARSLWDRSLDSDLGDVQVAANVLVRPRGPSADLTKYPAIKAALSALRVSEAQGTPIDPWATNEQARALKGVYEDIIGGGLYSILNTQAYSDEVKASAIWVIGEYRIFESRLLFGMAVPDAKGLTDAYPGRLGVAGDDRGYPGSATMLKAAPLPTGFIIDAIDLPDIPETARERIARVLMIVDPEGAKKELAEQTHAGTSEESKAVLRSLEAIIH